MPMHLKSLRFPLAIVLFNLSGVAALADERLGEHWGEMGRQGSALLQMDADKDGSLTRAEIEGSAAVRATEIDVNKDGAITVDEILAWHDRQRAQRMAEELARMDSDSNGVITVEEFQDARTWRMARLDRNGDGMIAPEEMRRDWPAGKRHHEHQPH